MPSVHHAGGVLGTSVGGSGTARQDAPASSSATPSTRHAIGSSRGPAPFSGSQSRVPMPGQSPLNFKFKLSVAGGGGVQARLAPRHDLTLRPSASTTGQLQSPSPSAPATVHREITGHTGVNTTTTTESWFASPLSQAAAFRFAAGMCLGTAFVSLMVGAAFVRCKNMQLRRSRRRMRVNETLLLYPVPITRRVVTAHARTSVESSQCLASQARRRFVPEAGGWTSSVTLKFTSVTAS